MYCFDNWLLKNLDKNQSSTKNADLPHIRIRNADF